MTIEPKTIREQIISLYGHVTGLKKELNTIKNNHSQSAVRVIDSGDDQWML